MTTMIEKMARAICVAEKVNPEDSASGMDPWTKMWTMYKPHARAALAAMLSPNKAMTVAGDNVEVDGISIIGCDESAIILRAMINAALAEKEW